MPRSAMTKRAALILAAFLLFPGLGLVTSGRAQSPEAPKSLSTQSNDVTTYKIGYLKQAVERPVPISRLDLPYEDDGIAGARLGIVDNNTTGRFMKQKFELDVANVPEKGDIVATAKAMAAKGEHFILVDAPAADLLKLADALKGQDVLIFNLSATDVELREQQCRANVLHIAPSRYQLADGLAQYLVWKKWNKWFLMEGVKPADKAMAAAFKRAAARFGGKIVEEREYKLITGSPRTDTGQQQIQKQMPVLTQGAPSYDVLLVADESEVFGYYLPYRTWDARLVAGTAGLVPSSWHPATEAWGAQQFQNRFEKLAKRTIRPLDYNSWVALRVVSEAAQRTRSGDFATLRDYILGPKFEIAGFKGQALSFRKWNHQMRQNIVVGTTHLPVSWSPQEGFLHRVNTLDTLGIDEPETKCKFQ